MPYQRKIKLRCNSNHFVLSLKTVQLIFAARKLGGKIAKMSLGEDKVIVMLVMKIVINLFEIFLH